MLLLPLLIYCMLSSLASLVILSNSCSMSSHSSQNASCKSSSRSVTTSTGGASLSKKKKKCQQIHFYRTYQDILKITCGGCYVSCESKNEEDNLYE